MWNLCLSVYVTIMLLFLAEFIFDFEVDVGIFWVDDNEFFICNDEAYLYKLLFDFERYFGLLVDR